MFENQRFYETLNVAPSAPLEVIKAAYRALAHLHHPDKNDNSSESLRLMRELNEAYQVLSDPVRRNLYDDWLCSRRKSAKADGSDYKRKESQDVKPRTESKPSDTPQRSEYTRHSNPNPPRPNPQSASEKPTELTNSDMVYGLLSVVACFIGLWFLFSSYSFKRNALETTGQITSHFQRGGVSGRPGTTVSYSFSLNGLEYRGSSTIGRQNVFTGTPIKIFYHREDPSNNQLALPNTTIGWAWFVAGIFGCVVFFEPHKRFRSS